MLLIIVLALGVIVGFVGAATFKIKSIHEMLEAQTTESEATEETTKK